MYTQLTFFKHINCKKWINFGLNFGMRLDSLLVLVQTGIFYLNEILL